MKQKILGYDILERSSVSAEDEDYAEVVIYDYINHRALPEEGQGLAHFADSSMGYYVAMKIEDDNVKFELHQGLSFLLLKKCNISKDEPRNNKTENTPPFGEFFSTQNCN